MNEGLTRLNHVGPHNPAVHESHLKYKGKRKPSASVGSGPFLWVSSLYTHTQTLGYSMNLDSDKCVLQTQFSKKPSR